MYRLLFEFSFVCERCQMKLDEKQFFNKDQHFFCQTCLYEIEPCARPSSTEIPERCQKCSENFRYGDSIGQYRSSFYHHHCFNCDQCGRSLLSLGHFEKDDNLLYCFNCYVESGPHCTTCNEPFLTGEILTQFNDCFYHRGCFLCQICQQQIEDKPFRFQQDKIICRPCLTNYHSDFDH